MALTKFQREVCHLIAENRLRSGESYVAGGAALNLLLGGRRISRDIDLFHDTEEALEATWSADRKLLTSNRLDVRVLRERTGFVEAVVSRGEESLLLQWVRDSAYRFFPLVRHEELGLTLHPFDLATNKVLALVGRLEVRDWIDLITCHDRIQRFGYLAWAACGKDPGFSPAMVLEEAGRANRHSAQEVGDLSFHGDPPDIGQLSRQWHGMLAEARQLLAVLPSKEAGKCVLAMNGEVYSGGLTELCDDLAKDAVLFHSGCIRGAYPQIAERQSPLGESR